MKNRDVFIQIVVEATGRPVEDVAASFDQFCELHPELKEDVDRPAPPGIMEKLRPEMPGIVVWALSGLRESRGTRHR